MIMITKKKFDRIIKRLKYFININDGFILSPDIVQELEKHKLWDVWSKNVRLNYYPNNYDIKIARERSLPEFIKHFRNEILL